MFRLDKTSFKIQTFEEADNTKNYWLNKTPAERWAAAWYLAASSFNIDYKMMFNTSNKIVILIHKITDNENTKYFNL